MSEVDFNTLFSHFLIIFPPFFAEKRYKLCNFAPKSRIVDKSFISVIFNNKQFTHVVDEREPRVENKMSKEKC